MNNFSLYFTLRPNNNLSKCKNNKKVLITEKQKTYLKSRIENSNEETQRAFFLLIIQHSLTTGVSTLEDIYEEKFPYKIKVKNKDQRINPKNLPDELITILLKFLRMCERSKKEENKE